MRISIFYCIILAMVMIACTKTSHKTPEDGVVGDYSWQLSMINETDGFSNLDINEQFGIRIKSSGKIFLFKDDKIEKIGYLTNKNQSSSELKKMTFLIDGYYHEIDFYNDNLYIKTWPFAAKCNYFKKN